MSRVEPPASVRERRQPSSPEAASSNLSCDAGAPAVVPPSREGPHHIDSAQAVHRRHDDGSDGATLRQLPSDPEAWELDRDRVADGVADSMRDNDERFPPDWRLSRRAGNAD